MNLKQIPLEQLVTVINKELGQGLSVNKTCDKLGIKKTTLRDHMERNGYKYNRDLHRYIKETQESLNSIQEEQGQDDRQEVTASNKAIEPTTDNVSNLIIPTEDIDVLKEMIEQYKKHKAVNGVPTGSIIIELPAEENGEFRKTLRLNKTIYMEFEKFCVENKQFTIKELVSQALKEFMEKYSVE